MTLPIAQNRSFVDFRSPVGTPQNYTHNMQDPRKKTDILPKIIANHPYVTGAIISTAIVGGAIIVGLPSLPVVVATGVIAVNKTKHGLKNIKRSVGGIGSSIAGGIAKFFRSNSNHDHFGGGNADGCRLDIGADVGVLSIMKTLSQVSLQPAITTVQSVVPAVHHADLVLPADHNAELVELPIVSPLSFRVETLPPISPVPFVEETLPQPSRGILVLQPSLAVVEQNVLPELHQVTIIQSVAPAVYQADLVLPADNAELVELPRIVPLPFVIEALPPILPTTFVEEILPQASRGLLSALAVVEQNASPEIYQATIIRNIAPAANRAELVLPGVSRELALPLTNVSIPDLPERRMQAGTNSHVFDDSISPASTSSSTSATPVRIKRRSVIPNHSTPDYSKISSRYMSPTARYSPSDSATERVSEIREEAREGLRQLEVAREQKRRAAIVQEKADKEEMQKKAKEKK